MRILVLDNYDSFTYNLVQYLQEICELSIEVFHEDVPEVESYLTNLLFIDEKPVSSVSVNRIRTDLTFGDRIQFSDSKAGISSDMIIRQIDFDFNSRTTRYEGDSTLTQLEMS